MPYNSKYGWAIKHTITKDKMMAFKHQTQSYRMRDGYKYDCYGDYHSKEEAKEVISKAREANCAAFYEANKDGYFRVFFMTGPCWERAIQAVEA